MKKSLVTLIPFTLLMACNPAPEPTKTEVSSAAEPAASPQKAKNAISKTSYTANVKLLASDEFGGRAPGTKGEELTVNFLVNEFKALGLAPANGNSYTQSVPLTSVEVTNSPHLTFTDNNGEQIVLAYGTEQVIWSRKQISSSAINNSELVFVGYGINAPERGWNDYQDIDVKGKTVVMLVNDPGYATQDDSLFNGNAMTYYGRWDYKFDEASKQGAAGAIIIHDTKPAAYGWATVSASWTGPQFDMVRADKGENLAAVEGWITKEQAVGLFERAGLNLDEQYTAAQTQGFKAVPLAGTVSASIETKINHVNSRNVAAMIKGSESPDDVFIYMAHWDHIGTDPTVEGDGIYNGALDNATGTAGLVELARAYTALSEKPKRSVMFLAVTAEEQGLLGSAYYAASPLVPLANTIGGLNMDGLNNFGRTKDVTVIGLGMSELESFLEKRAKEQGRTLTSDSEAEKGYFYRSDHFELAKLGVPMLYPNSGSAHIEKGVAYVEEKANEYLSNHYHGPSDEYNENWVMDGAIEDLQLYFLTGLDVVNAGQWPNWHQGTEFKAARDKSRKE
ncbi:M28 family metallopeptidase [Thalassotalea atypica]|uniref:M28 family metallopeptidase n=1 Tax=Thalassotalea atypica TaxID=2054316 RepID=UPI0025727342|nr:M28 family metallopeptidase [Thalassotalea atypica]